MLNTVRHGLLLLLALFAFSSLAQASLGPREVVQKTTDELIADLQANKAQYRQNPSDFYEALHRILGPVVDARGISRSIMTVKYSRRATPQQMARFEENFKRGLMQFYGNALLEYDNQQIRVLNAKMAPEGDRASVDMEVVGAQGVVYPVSYTMVNEGGQWLLRNVIINGINVGKLFRDQFDSAMQRNGGNLDKTIDGWVQVVAEAKEAAGQANGGE